MAETTFPEVAAILDCDPFQSEQPNDTGSTVMRRAASAIRTIARLVNNSILEEGNDPEVALSRASQSGLLDALELIAYAMQYEAELVDDNAQAGAG